MRQRGKILFKVLGVLAGLTMTGMGFSERADMNRVRKLGKPAVVDPISGYTQHRSRGSTTYTAEFRFKTENGQQIVTKHAFPEELISDFKAGTPVRVLYLPGDPSTMVFEKDSPSWLPMILGVGLALAALLFA